MYQILSDFDTVDKWTFFICKALLKMYKVILNVIAEIDI